MNIKHGMFNSSLSGVHYFNPLTTDHNNVTQFLKRNIYIRYITVILLYNKKFVGV